MEKLDNISKYPNWAFAEVRGEAFHFLRENNIEFDRQGLNLLKFPKGKLIVNICQTEIDTSLKEAYEKQGFEFITFLPFQGENIEDFLASRLSSL